MSTSPQVKLHDCIILLEIRPLGLSCELSESALNEDLNKRSTLHFVTTNKDNRKLHFFPNLTIFSIIRRGTSMLLKAPELRKMLNILNITYEKYRNTKKGWSTLAQRVSGKNIPTRNCRVAHPTADNAFILTHPVCIYRDFSTWDILFFSALIVFVLVLRSA